MRLTPEILRGAYEFLRLTDPFRRWGMPAPEYVKFVVSRSKKVMGDYVVLPNCHRIRVSECLHNHTDTLIHTMAHEMTHLRQTIQGRCREGVEHNGDFRKQWAIVCRHHGFDPQL